MTPPISESDLRNHGLTNSVLPRHLSLRDSDRGSDRDDLLASASISGLVTAIDTVRATETGGVLRRLNFRILGYLFDQGYLPGVTLAP